MQWDIQGVDRPAPETRDEIDQLIGALLELDEALVALTRPDGAVLQLVLGKEGPVAILAMAGPGRPMRHGRPERWPREEIVDLLDAYRREDPLWVEGVNWDGLPPDIRPGAARRLPAPGMALRVWTGVCLVLGPLAWVGGVLAGLADLADPGLAGLTGIVIGYFGWVPLLLYWVLPLARTRVEARLGVALQEVLEDEGPRWEPPPGTLLRTRILVGLAYWAVMLAGLILPLIAATVPLALMK